MQLLKDYRSFWSAFGGAMPLEDSHLRSASYGPAGLIQAGTIFEKKDRRLLAESYEALEHALKMLKAEHFEAWLVLLAPYLGDPGDPSLVARWRESKPGLAGWHDYAVEKLAGYLRTTELYVVFPKRPSLREQKQMEKMNDEFHELYQRFRNEGSKKRKAIRDAAQMCGYSESRGYEIVRLREGGEKRPRAG